MGGVAEGVLACRRVLATPKGIAERLLAQDHGPERVHRSLPTFPGMLSEPPGADPHAGWCGRGQGEPGPYPIPREPGAATPPATRPGSRARSKQGAGLSLRPDAARWFPRWASKVHAF